MSCHTAWRLLESLQHSYTHLIRATSVWGGTRNVGTITVGGTNWVVQVCRTPCITCARTVCICGVVKTQHPVLQLAAVTLMVVDCEEPIGSAASAAWQLTLGGLLVGPIAYISAQISGLPLC